MRYSRLLASALIGTLAIAKCAASAAASNLTMEAAQFFPQYNSQRVKIRYGPFNTKSRDVDNGMVSFVQRNITKPCTDCAITFMQAGLEYEDGTIADANTHLWLHHAVIFNLNKISPVCPSPDKIFATGNERTPIDISSNGAYEAGYYLEPDDSIGMTTELMNMANSPQTAYVTITWEYVTRPPPSFSNVKVLWLDIGGCRSSDQYPESTTRAFNYTSPDWVSDISGRVTFIGGHLHDGGTHLNVKKNGMDQCDCVATYGASPVHSSDLMAGTASLLLSDTHISDISVCQNMNNVMIEPGDSWTITAHYDPTQHNLMLNTDGTLEPIMGIALVYVADKDVVSAPFQRSQPINQQYSLWPLMVLLIAVAAITYIFRSKHKDKLALNSSGYKLLQVDES